MKVFVRKPDFTISKNGIDELISIPLGGIEQKILIQSENPQNPILLNLHGGPSLPVPSISNRGVDYALITCTKELVKHFTLVYWDQRGTGKTFSKEIPKETMHLNQFINDAKELTDYLLNRFNQTQLHLMAHSWGTIIALPLIKKYPEKIFSYIGVSQVTNWVENDKYCYQWLMNQAKETGNRKAM